MVNEAELRAALTAGLGPHAASLGGSAVSNAVRNIFRRLGPYPVGDPAAMRTTANTLRAIARDCSSQGDRVVGAVNRCGGWEGGAQRRMRAGSIHERSLVHQDANALDAAARRLDIDAGDLERRRADWSSRVPGLREEALGGLLASVRRLT